MGSRFEIKCILKETTPHKGSIPPAPTVKYESWLYAWCCAFLLHHMCNSEMGNTRRVPYGIALIAEIVFGRCALTVAYLRSSSLRAVPDSFAISSVRTEHHSWSSPRSEKASTSIGHRKYHSSSRIQKWTSSSSGYLLPPVSLAYKARECVEVPCNTIIDTQYDFITTERNSLRRHSVNRKSSLLHSNCG